MDKSNLKRSCSTRRLLQLYYLCPKKKKVKKKKYKFKKKKKAGKWIQ